jgi:hypothetical protein
MQHGFQRLVLLGSAGYSRAELPLDGAVSLVAPNNTGKTSLINALQFLLIIDQRRMDFGAHDVEKSKRFYFPNNSAYVLLEVSLPESGTVVLGCVGKGVSFDYEYFAYAGPLKVEEFCLPDGSIVPQPKLAIHLATHGRRVFSYKSSGEFADMVYGGRNRKLGDSQDFCVFRLEHASDASVFQRVLTRTLRLDKLRSSEVKDYLLQIFRRDLPDASIDFKAEWDKAFADLNAERGQYLAAERLKGSIAELERKQDARLTLRGKLLCWRPMIDEALVQWQQHFESRQQALQHKMQQCDGELDRLRAQDLQAVREQSQWEQEQKQLRQERQQLQTLQQRFALVESRAVLETCRRDVQTQRDALVVRLSQAQSRPPASIERELARVDKEITQLTQEMRTQGHNLYQHLAGALPPDQLSALNKVLAKPVLTLGAEDFHLDVPALSKALGDANSERVSLPGLHLRVAVLPEQHKQRSLAELGELLRDLQQQQAQLKEQMATAQALELVQRERDGLETQLAQIDAELRDYSQMQALQDSDAERQARLATLDQKLAEMAASLAQSVVRYRALDQQRQQTQKDLDLLAQQHRQIEKNRNQRIDQEGPFTWLPDLPHHPWLAQPDFTLDQLADRLQTYQADCRQLLDLEDQIRQLLSEIHAGGLTKYQFVGDPESEIARLVEFAHHLPQEAEALEKKVRSAVVNVAACLRELRDGLAAFKRRMREFNRKISGRQLSDLAVFKIEPEDETALVEAIEMLISTAATVGSGETFELFNQQSVLDDDQLNRAKTLLIEEGNARHGLRVADLFRLRFWVGKADREPEAFDDIDSAASNGTVLMAKLVTGLAMLHLMQDQRRQIQGICYLDEALALDARNQRNLIETAAEFGFSLIFASPAPLTTARYCVPIHTRNGSNQISRFSWQIIEPVEA